MSNVLTPDLCIIGAGSGGLSVAAGAVQMGASVVLIEGHKMGGDCLNYGCVPSKALIAAAKKAHIHRHSGAFGIAAHEPAVDYAAAMGHVQSVIAGIAPHDSVERFESLGCTVIEDYARFTGPAEVEAGGTRVRARRFVIATGSSPAVPPIPGLDTVPYLTNETLWENRVLPETLIVIGGGPIGLEMAQAHRRLGSNVIVLEAATAMGKDDPEIAAIALEALRGEGIDIREETAAERVEGTEGQITVHLQGGGVVTGSHLLVATGRSANIDKLDLEAGNIASTRAGVTVDRGLRSTTNRKVYAIGDVAGGLQFTHVANYHAGLVVRNALFRLPVANQTHHLPWVTYTDPEVAQIGLTEAEAREKIGDKLEVHRFSFAENDRSRAELRTEGLIKGVFCTSGKIHGVSIVGAGAGELIGPWALALSKGLKVKDMAGMVAPYPTLGEVNKRVAGAYFGKRLFESDMVKRVVRLLARLG
ncbi:FAD-dependent oxidoreductase [Rhodobacteraceae bacterium NNCM2]|nr:FAD-dependent oxidoreductase [Coraliihabitans acroporae]